MRPAAAFSAMMVCAWLLPAQTVSKELENLETRANQEFEARDCTAAEKTLNETVQRARLEGLRERTVSYFSRIANCRFRAGDVAGALAAYQTNIAVLDSIGDREALAVNLNGAAVMLQRLGRLEEAKLLIARQNVIAEQCGHPVHIVRALLMTASYAQETGRTRDAIHILLRAVAINRTTDQTFMTAIILQRLSAAYAGVGDLLSAAQMENDILSMPTAAVVTMSSSYSRASSYNNLGEFQAKSGHVAEARQLFERALENSEGPEQWHVHMIALLNLSELQNKLGDFAGSDAGFQEALGIAQRVKSVDLESAAWQIRSDNLLGRGDISGANAAAEKALALARPPGLPNRIFKALSALAAALTAANDHAAARNCYEEAIGIAEIIRAQSPGEVSDLSRSYANLVPLYQASVRNLISLDMPREALQRAEQAKARVLMDLLLRGGVNEAATLTPAEAGGQEVLRNRLMEMSRKSAGTPQEAALLAEYRQFRRGLYDNHPELAVQSADFEPADESKLAVLLPDSKTALLDYFFVPGGLALFVFRKPSDVVPPLLHVYLLADPKHTLAGEVKAFREQLARRDLGYKVAAGKLFQRLLGPAAVALRGTSHWIISPDAALWNAPFEALLDDAGKHLMETHAVTITPSLTAALEMHKRAILRGPVPPTLLAFGNPLPSEAPLPNAAREVTEIALGYPGAKSFVLTGTRATAAEFRQRAPAAGIIHLAAHAGLQPGDPLASYIRLAPGDKEPAASGLVTALDLLPLRLNADLVVLSACESALGAEGPGEGMVGMGWALSAAGASSSVLSLWKVDSAATRQLMTWFYRDLRRGMPRAEALRQAGLHLLQGGTYTHPFYWAAFTLWGEGTPVR